MNVGRLRLFVSDSLRFLSVFDPAQTVMDHVFTVYVSRGILEAQTFIWLESFSKIFLRCIRKLCE